MNHEHEHRHARATAAAARPNDGMEPGQSSRSAVLRKPDEAIASGLVQRSADGPHGLADGAPNAIGVARSSSGAPLPETLMRQFESSLGVDLSGVRVHTGAVSARSAATVSAKAYAMGNDIHFGAGYYDPVSSGGQHLLAHEVAHTVQQSRGVSEPQCKLEVSEPGDACEVEADRAADAMIGGRPFRVGSAGGAHRSVMRQVGGGTDVPAIDPVVDQQRARAEAARRLTIGTADDHQLIQLARQLDPEVVMPPLTMGPRERAAKAETLVAIYQLLQTRMSQPRDGLGIDADGLPERSEPGAIGAADFDAGSPLAGILDDIAPFGNYDQWSMLAHSPSAPPARQSRSHPHPHEPGPAHHQPAPHPSQPTPHPSQPTPHPSQPTPHPSQPTPHLSRPTRSATRDQSPAAEGGDDGRWHEVPGERLAFAQEAIAHLREGFLRVRSAARDEFPLGRFADDRNEGILIAGDRLDGYSSTVRHLLTTPRENFDAVLEYHFGPTRLPHATEGAVDHSLSWRHGARRATEAWNHLSELERRAVRSGSEWRDLEAEFLDLVRAENDIRQL